MKAKRREISLCAGPVRNDVRGGNFYVGAKAPTPKAERWRDKLAATLLFARRARGVRGSEFDRAWTAWRRGGESGRGDAERCGWRSAVCCCRSAADGHGVAPVAFRPAIPGFVA